MHSNGWVTQTITTNFKQFYTDASQAFNSGNQRLFLIFPVNLFSYRLAVLRLILRSLLRSFLRLR
ncbi:hypothetical protein AAKU64_003595 [Undibacterium sp. GrIS 1.8]